MRIEFHRSASGRSYFEEFLRDLSDEDRAAILAVFDDIRKFGFGAIGCSFRQIEGKLWEIKIKTASGGQRFFYVMLSSDLMHVLHAYKKKTPKAPPRELEIARRRLKEVLL
jgi:phage-related protein